MVAPVPAISAVLGRTGLTSFAPDYQSKAGVNDFDSVSAMYALGKAEAVN